MLALTLWQPWAWAILRLPLGLAKPVENRDWMPPRGVIGTRIALHGGLRWDADGAARVCLITGRTATFGVPRGLPAAARQLGILGTVRLVGVVEERRGRFEPVGRIELVAGGWGEVTRELCAPWFVGRYGWLFDQRRVLDTPIPCRGLQKLWTVPDDVAARVEG